jgi:hypothetical protein
MFFMLHIFGQYELAKQNYVGLTQFDHRFSSTRTNFMADFKTNGVTSTFFHRTIGC